MTELTAASPFDPPRLRQGWTIVTIPCSCRQDGPGGLSPSIHPEDPALDFWCLCTFCSGRGTKIKEVRNDD
jgi:hypothetical protein